MLLLVVLGCEEPPSEQQVFLEVSVQPAQLNLAGFTDCQPDPSANQAIVTATVFNMAVAEAQVVFKVDTESMATLVPNVADQGNGGFYAIDSVPPASPPPNIVATAQPGAESIRVGFACTQKGKVMIVGQEVSSRAVSEVKTLICDQRNPQAFAFTVTARDGSTEPGSANPIVIEGDDGQGGKYLAAQRIMIRASSGGLLLPDSSDSVTRSLLVDQTSGKAKPSSGVEFLCPEQEGHYQVVVEFFDKVKNCDRRWTGYVLCSKEGAKDKILIDVDPDMVQAAREDEPPPRSNRSDVLVTIYGHEGLLPGQEFTLSTDLGGFVRQVGDVPAKLVTARTDDQGRHRIIFVGGSRAGVATLEAESTLRGEVYLPNRTLLVQTTTLINVVGASSVEYRSAVPGLLGVKGSGFNESSRISFKVVGSDGNPYPAGLQVMFDIVSNAGGASLKSPWDLTDENGLVSTYLDSGRIAANVTVRATVVQNNISSDSPAIPIVGIKPSWNGFALRCELKNIGAFMETDGINSLMMKSIPCRATLKDRFGNPVGLSTSVSFRSEAGSITASSPSTPQALTGEGGAAGAQPDVGDVLAF
ncbi:MAG: hypothetical protein FJ125_13935, partial [Deltaproteobacteria bacterium]|nr:hypothetical protein [Deltaproteobacteria bacterium]